MKTCTKCGIEKPLTEFYLQKARGDGRTSSCKVCRRKDQNNRNADKAIAPRIKSYVKRRRPCEFAATDYANSVVKDKGSDEWTLVFHTRLEELWAEVKNG